MNKIDSIFGNLCGLNEQVLIIRARKRKKMVDFNGGYSPERSPNPNLSVNSSTNTLGSSSSSRSLKNHRQ
ncbi:hypothetical protein Ancab_013233 [Ancistrocladus abbreviatus]